MVGIGIGIAIGIADRPLKALNGSDAKTKNGKHMIYGV